MKIIKVRTTTQVPSVPNFLRLEPSGTIPLGDVEDDSLREIGKAWTTELLNRANEQRTQKKRKS